VAVSAVQIVLYCLLIPRYGIAGAAVATSASLIVTVLVRVVQVHRVLRVWPYQADLVKPLAAGLAAALPVVAVKLLGAPPIGFLVGAFALSYLGVLAMLGFHESDRAVVLQLTRRLMRRAGE
jgi:O-antigen/teichoic acid export membrane protein